VAHCKHFLLFCSAHFFSSPNCVRELICAVLWGKPIVMLSEADQKHGYITRDEVKDLLREVVTRYAEWGLTDELCNTGFAKLPSAEQLYAAMYAMEPIVWERGVFFQDVSLRLLAECLLPHSLQGATYVQGELTRQEMVVTSPRGGRRFHLFCCAHNAGARELASELSAHLGQTLEVTSDIGKVGACERALLYLNGQTWTSGAACNALAHYIEVAM